MYLRQAHPLRGILFAGILIALAIWAYKHITSEPPTDGHVQKNGLEAAPRPGKGKQTILEKVSDGSKKLFSGEALGKPLNERPASEVTNPRIQPARSPEETIRNFYRDLR